MGSSESNLPRTGPDSILPSPTTSRDRNRDFSMFLPFLLSLNESDSDPDSGENTSPDAEQNPSDGSDRQRGDRIMLINPLTQGMVVIEGANLRSLLGNIPTKTEQRPASKASIEAMPIVVVTEDEEGECAICLDEWKAKAAAAASTEGTPEEIQDGCGGSDGGAGSGVVVKQMPCKHRFHGECIEKWLRMHGSCPVCRFRMPNEDEDDDEKKSGDGETEDGDGDEAGRPTRRRWGAGRGVWVSFGFGSRRRDSEHLGDDSDSDDGDEGSS